MEETILTEYRIDNKGVVWTYEQYKYDFLSKHIVPEDQIKYYFEKFTPVEIKVLKK